jgi:succinate-acetate transporter protein
LNEVALDSNGTDGQAMTANGSAVDRDRHVRIMLRPVGTPIALALSAILIASTMLSGLQLGWIGGVTDQQTVAYVALAGAFPLQLLAAVLSFLARDPLAGTGLGTFASVWAVTGLTLLNGQPGATNDALGMFLIVAAVILALLLISSGGGRIVLGAVIACGAVRLGLTGLYELTATHWIEDAAGIAGLVLAAACAYGIVALLSEDLPRARLLPSGRSGMAATSVAGDFSEQLETLQNEAGVRRVL